MEVKVTWCDSMVAFLQYLGLYRAGSGVMERCFVHYRWREEVLQFGQLQKLKGHSIDSVENSGNKRNVG